MPTRLYSLIGLMVGMSLLLWAQVTLISQFTKRAKTTISPASISPLLSGQNGPLSSAQPTSGQAPSTLPASLPALPPGWPSPEVPGEAPSGPTAPPSGAPGGSSPSPSSAPPAASPTTPSFRKETWTPITPHRLPEGTQAGSNPGGRDHWR